MARQYDKVLDVAKVIGIQFSILSPDEIRNGSVVKITSKDTYVDNKPVIGGLFDPRMGVLEAGMICPTDGLDYMQTPGYAGHLELATPVFYIQFLNTILKILRCVCYKCSKLLISKHKYKQALKLTGSHRWKYVFAIADKIKRCGEDTEDGCGCLQPAKIKHEGLATVTAVWKLPPTGEGEPVGIRLTPEMVLRIFRRISDEDVTFMGFSPVYSRPDWMICQVLSVPPPAMRPSIKHDAQQRSEDDLSHILVNIIKANNMLRQKMADPTPNHTAIHDWTVMLQYYVAMQVDNHIPNVASVAQRSGRPLKCIKDRLNGKGGRMRGNLMAKRVDYSARSVITADPNISIRELGIPLRIAMTLTKPMTVNPRNRAFLTKLVQNGADLWPGAKTLDRRNGESIMLKYRKQREQLVLEDGDVVHRHMMDGDPIVFNRQPSLHRMSIMCHIARIMRQGGTFRMNVADTKPYNADFDGDEMNLHMPQDLESEAELRHLAAVPYQIVSPANNAAIIGIYQDSLLGAFLFTRPEVRVSLAAATTLLLMFDELDAIALLDAAAGAEAAGHVKDTVSYRDILSQILPPITLRIAGKPDQEESGRGGGMTIARGQYLSGRLDKAALGGRSQGLLQRICNEFGNLASAKFVDDLQNVVTEYMNATGFSVGISDLISATKAQADAQIAVELDGSDDKVHALMEQLRMGVFENSSGSSNEVEFERQVKCLLNTASANAGKLGTNALATTNRFKQMVQAGSKGSDLNITFMVSSLGQQDVDGKRIPYGFEHRTLPHFTKFDDSPSARGFVRSSYINGLSPQELFMHAMGGRVGLIDTAVKTSTTGYIQRRLIKALEDLKIEYDMTVRTNKNKIVQFRYGDDGIDTTKVENQSIPLVDMALRFKALCAHFLGQPRYSVEEIRSAHTADPDLFGEQLRVYKQNMLPVVKKAMRWRKLLMQHVFQNKKKDSVASPVAFGHILNTVHAQCGISKEASRSDLLLQDALHLVRAYYARLCASHYCAPTELFECLFWYHLSPVKLVMQWRFSRASLEVLLNAVTMYYKQAIVAPGEMVGMIAGQSIGEVSTQMTLNTFHFAGVSSKSNVTRGVPRIQEILSLSDKIKNPSLSVYLPPADETSKEKAQAIMYMLEHTCLGELVSEATICFDPDALKTLLREDELCLRQFCAFEKMVSEAAGTEIDTETGAAASKWIVRLVMNAEAMLEKNITMDDVHFTLTSFYKEQIVCVYSDFNADKLVFRIRMVHVSKKQQRMKSLEQTDEIYVLKNFQDQMLKKVVLRGIKGIEKVTLRKVLDYITEDPIGAPAAPASANASANASAANASANASANDDCAADATVESGSNAPSGTAIWVLDTVGCNLLEVLGLDFVDASRTVSNDINETFQVLGIEAARQTIYNELVEVIEYDGTYINYHNYSVLIDRMTYTHKLISIFRHGINNDDVGPIAKASFEETPEMFLKAARHAELDTMRGVSANVMCGQEGHFGTAAFQVMLDKTALDDGKLNRHVSATFDAYGERSVSARNLGDVDRAFAELDAARDLTLCTPASIAMHTHTETILAECRPQGADADYDPGF